MYYKNDYGNIFGNTFTTPVGRLQFVALAEAKEFRGKAKLGATLLFDKATQDSWLPGFALIENDIAGMIAQEYPDGAPAFKYPMLRDGDSEKYNGFAGRWYIKASAGVNDARIGVYDAAGKTIDPSLPVAGMLARAVVRVGLFDNGVSYKLVAVQLIKDDGVRFTGAPDPLNFLSDSPIVGYEGGDTFVAPAVVAPSMQAVAVAPIAAKTGAIQAARPTAPVSVPRASTNLSVQRQTPATSMGAANVAKAPQQPPVQVAPAAQLRPAAVPARPAAPAQAAKPATGPAAGGRGLAGVAKLNGMV